jgi:Icc protein
LVGSAWVDRLGLKNADVFWEAVQPYSQVKNVLFGHIHQVYSGNKNGIHLYSAPSTCIQFKPNTERFALDFLPPGYRWIDLRSNGALETGVTRCTEYVGTFEADAKGY